MQLSSLPADYDLWLYNPLGTPVAVSENSSTAAERVQWKTTSSGDFRCALFGFDDKWSTSPYTLRVDRTALIYTVASRVTDGSANGLAAVSISDEAGHSVTTDSAGNYTLSGLTEGMYTITPSKSGHSFSPASRSVTVPPSATGVDFTASFDPHSSKRGPGPRRQAGEADDAVDLEWTAPGAMAPAAARPRRT